MSTVINVFVKQSIRENRIPFMMGDPKSNADSLEAIREVEAPKTIGDGSWC